MAAGAKIRRMRDTVGNVLRAKDEEGFRVAAVIMVKDNGAELVNAVVVVEDSVIACKGLEAELDELAFRYSAKVVDRRAREEGRGNGTVQSETIN